MSMTREQKNRRRWFRRRGWRTDTDRNGWTWLETPAYDICHYTDRAYQNKWVKQTKAIMEIRKWHKKGSVGISVYQRDWYIDGPKAQEQKDVWPHQCVTIRLTADELRKIADIIDEEE